MIVLKDYQEQAVEDLKQGFERCLQSSENRVIIFQSPTGSGKTVMVSELLKRIVRNRNDGRTFSFIWISVRMLHEQSKEKLEKYYEDDQTLLCSHFEDLNDKKIGENEILFINWHSINKKDINIYVRDNEQDNNLNAIIENTKKEGRDIILIIDESHHTASGEKSKELIEVIGPKVTIEVSATPHIKEKICSWVPVDLSSVKAEEMIKSEISVNPEFLNLKVDGKSSDELVIEQALKKREELVQLFKKEGCIINPLILVQLPDKKSILVNKKDVVLKILKKKGLTDRNGKLAIWLSEKKTDTLINIEKKGTIDVQLNVAELQQRFDLFISQNCTPYAPVDSSDRMKTAIYLFFTQKYKIRKFDPRVQRIVLGLENVQVFVDAINMAKEQYQEKVFETQSKKRKVIEEPKWEVPAIINYNSKYQQEKKNKSIMNPYYTKKPSQPEKQFIDMLEASKRSNGGLRTVRAKSNISLYLTMTRLDLTGRFISTS